MNTKGLKTPTLRRIARQLAKAYLWQQAIDMMQLAIDRCPAGKETHGMERAIMEWKPKVNTRTLRVYTFGPGVKVPGHARLGATHDGIPADLSDAEILARYGIPAHWRATLQTGDDVRMIQEAVFPLGAVPEDK